MVAKTAVGNVFSSLWLTKEAKQYNIKVKICMTKKWFSSLKEVEREGIVWVYC